MLLYFISHIHILNLSTIKCMDSFPQHFRAVQASIGRKEKGRLVCIAPKKKADGNPLVQGIERFVECYQLSLTKRASLFDFTESFDMYPKELRQDMDFLLKLLATRQVRPQTDRFIRLSDVPKAHQEMQLRPLAGSIICEPWKDY